MFIIQGVKNMKKSSDKNIWFYDIESTGLDVKNDRIIEIAFISHYDDKINFESLINPEQKIPQESSRIHGIVDDDVKNSPKIKEVLEKIIEFCGEHAYFIAHNNDRFDELIFRAEAERVGIEIPKTWVFLDSIKWAKKYRPDLRFHNLQYLREVFGIEKNQAHRAVDDTIVLKNIFDYLTGDLSIEDIVERLIVSPNKMVMPFGKFKGQLLSELSDRYISWLYSSKVIFEPSNIRLKQAIETLNKSIESEISLI